MIKNLIFISGLIFIVVLVAVMIFELYTGYKVLKKYEQTNETMLTDIVQKKLKTAVVSAFLSIALTAMWVVV